MLLLSVRSVPERPVMETDTLAEGWVVSATV